MFGFIKKGFFYGINNFIKFSQYNSLDLYFSK